MNSIKLLSILFILSSCGTNHSDEKTIQANASFELSGTDTVNLIDENGLRQGIWIKNPSKDTLVYLNDTGFSAKTITTGEIVASFMLNKTIHYHD